MSVIAWDGKSIVADKMMTNEGMQSIATKLFKLNSGEIAAFTGDLCEGLALIDWYNNGHKKEDWPEFQTMENFTRMVVATSDGIVFYDQLPVAVKIQDKFHAWGSGRDYAMGAMSMGATAMEAVEIACKHSIHCGNGVDSFKLE